MIDYSIYYRTELPVDGSWSRKFSWDVFISCFNSSDRVNNLFDMVSAKTKHWLALPVFDFRSDELPQTGTLFESSLHGEGEFILEFLREHIDTSNLGLRICIDITGFVKPYVMALLMELHSCGFKKIDVLYSEPLAYLRSEETKFSDEAVQDVRQVYGFEGVHTVDFSRDLLIIGSGYDHELIKHAAQAKDRARKMQMFGFPPLKADMYQENVLRARKAADAVGAREWLHPDNLFAPANDPFVTAEVLSRVVAKAEMDGNLTNLYLCPLATEAQALGFTLFYLHERRGTATSMLFPFCRSYPKSTSTGVARMWLFSLDLP